MKIIKDSRNIKYLYHYTNKENVDIILSSEKITSSDNFTFFTDSYYKSISLFENEMMSNKHYYDLDCKLKRRSYANPDDYRILKIPYYNDGKFVRIKFDKSKNNIYDKSVIHEGDVCFNKNEVEVLDIPISYNKSSAFGLLFGKLAALMLFLAPLKVSADTWLDDPSYKDISWFDESTYDSTDTFTINSASKLAGLLYEVNVKGYTFQGKTVRLVGNSPGRYCTSSTCKIDMSAHDWVPLSSSFSGTFDNRHTPTDWRCGSHRVILASLNKKIDFMENKSCTRFVASDRTAEDLSETTTDSNCTIPEYNVYYSIHNNEPSHATVSVSDKSLPSKSVSAYVYPDDGYVVESIGVQDKNGDAVTLTGSSTTYVRFNMPASEVYITINLKKLDLPEQPEFPTVEDNVGCRVISGGNTLGSEIACGSEHFYVLDTNEEDVRMMAKYNLYYGINIYKEKINKAEGDTRTDEQYCSELAYYKGSIVRSDAFYNAPGYCFYQYSIPQQRVLQWENAKSAQWNSDGTYVYPQIGDVYPGYQNYSTDFVFGQLDSSKYDGYFYDLTVNLNSPYNMSNSLNMYLYELGNQNIQVKEINLPTLDDLNMIVKERGGSIPYSEWHENALNIDLSVPGQKLQFGTLKDYLGKDDKWIYDRTYWLRTGHETTTDNSLGIKALAFVDSAGDVCGSGFRTSYSACSYLTQTEVGCGVRPTIIVPKTQIKYLIKPKNTDKVNIEVIDSANGNTDIHFKITIKKDYKVKRIIVETDSGEVVEFDEGEIITNEDGTITLDKNKFTMPFDNVVIKANVVPKNILVNPKTRSEIIIVTIVLLGVGGGLVISRKKKINAK